MIRQKVKGEYRMLLQKLLWPRVGICTEDRLYYRMKAPSFRDEGDILRIEQGERVCFDTYFNSVSASFDQRFCSCACCNVTCDHLKIRECILDHSYGTKYIC